MGGIRGVGGAAVRIERLNTLGIPVVMIEID